MPKLLLETAFMQAHHRSASLRNAQLLLRIIRLARRKPETTRTPDARWSGVVRAALTDHAGPATVAEIAKNFTRARKDAVEELLDTLVTVGQARQTSDGRYVA